MSLVLEREIVSGAASEKNPWFLDILDEIDDSYCFRYRSPLIAVVITGRGRYHLFAKSLSRQSLKPPAHRMGAPVFSARFSLFLFCLLSKIPAYLSARISLWRLRQGTGLSQRSAPW